MKLILRFLLRNIAEKKGRTLLIILSVMLSCALLLATNGMGTTMKDMFARRMSQYFGSAQIIIHPNRRSPSWLHSPGRLERSGLELTYMVSTIESRGEIHMAGGDWSEIYIRGFTLEGLQTMSPPVWIGGAPKEFRGNMVILAEHSASRFGVGIGDALTVHIGGTVHRLFVTAIARSKGLFTDDGRTHTLIIPLDKIATAAAGRGRASTTYVRAKNPEDVPQLIEAIKKIYPRYEVRETVSKEQIDSWTQDMTTPFTIMSFLVFFMSVFIIYTAFRVITIERLSVIGTFRSIGATQRATAGILIAESILYGILGGIPGALAGLGVLRLLVTVSAWEWLDAVPTRLVVTPLQVISALAAAVLLSAGSAAVPIFQAARLPVKDVVLGTVRHHVHRRPAVYIAGALFIVTGTTLPHLIPDRLLMVVGSGSIFIIIVGSVMILPWLVRHLVNVAASLNRRLFGNVGELAAKNLRDDPSVINNIALLTIGITGIFMITTMSLSAIHSLTEFYRHARFDVWMWTQNPDRTTEARLRSIKGLEALKGVFEISEVEIEGREEKIGDILAVEGTDLMDWWEYPIHDDDPMALLGRLDDGRCLILSLKTKRRLDVQIGDTLTLLLGEPQRPRTYEVIGFLTVGDDVNGFALMGARWFKLDTGRTHYSDIWIKSRGDPQEVKEAIEKKFRRRALWVDTLKEIEKSSAAQMREIFLMLQFFSILAMLIASIGIVNNYLVSYLERRRILAVIRSVGMDKRQATRMLLVEALTGGILGALTGLAGGLAVVSFLPAYMVAFDLAIELVISPVRVVLLLTLGAALSLGAQVFPSMKSKRMNLVEMLKYE